MDKEQILKTIDEIGAEIRRIDVNEVEPLRQKKKELERQLKEYDAEKVVIEAVDFEKIKTDYLTKEVSIEETIKK